jgi:lipopolysaccharide/colanic/teichoic acid biosynthesis glycosyltransferase
VELNFVPDRLHGIGSSIKQTEVSNDQTRKTDNAAKKIIIVVVARIIVIILILIIVIVVNYGMSSLISFLEPFRFKLHRLLGCDTVL